MQLIVDLKGFLPNTQGGLHLQILQLSDHTVLLLEFLLLLADTYKVLRLDRDRFAQAPLSRTLSALHYCDAILDLLQVLLFLEVDFGPGLHALTPLPISLTLSGRAQAYPWVDALHLILSPLLDE